MRRFGGAEFETLYRMHYRRAVGFAHLLTGGHEGEDLAQEGFLRAFRRWNPAGPPEAFWKWLQTTMLRLHLNAIRRAASEARAFARRGPDAETDRERQHAELLDALRSLSPRQRAAVILRYYEDLPESEVAARLGCRLGTAKALLHQARRRLRIIVEEESSGP
jgi:RNA polymerase sigma factor (sigma-70 family)